MKDDVIQMVLAKQNIRVPLDVIAQWTLEQKQQSTRYAASLALNRIDQQCPEFLKRYMIAVRPS